MKDFAALAALLMKGQGPQPVGDVVKGPNSWFQDQPVKQIDPLLEALQRGPVPMAPGPMGPGTGPQGALSRPPTAKDSAQTSFGGVQIGPSQWKPGMPKASPKYDKMIGDLNHAARTMQRMDNVDPKWAKIASDTGINPNTINQVVQGLQRGGMQVTDQTLRYYLALMKQRGEI